MAGKLDCHLARCLAFDRDFFAHGSHRREPVLILVLVRILRIELIDIQILLIHIKARQAKGDGAVMADRETGQEGFAGPDDIKPWRDDMRDVAQAWGAMRAVRIVGQDGTTGCAPGGSDGPVIAANRG
jgi:hypothetical protein